MADDMNTQDDQALADEWAAALEETGDAGQADIDALLAADASSSSNNRLPMEEFGSVPRSNDPVSLEGPNLDVILDIPVSISMEVGSTDINIRNLLQLNQGSVIELIGSRALGPRDRLMLVQVGNEQILLGLSPGTITALHVLKEPVQVPTATPTATPEFAQRLMELLGKDQKDKK